MSYFQTSPSANNVSYDNSISSIPASNLQEAIDYLASNSGPAPSPVDYSIKGSLVINQNSLLNINSFGVLITKNPLFVLTLQGHVILHQASSLTVTGNGVVSINSI